MKQVIQHSTRKDYFQQRLAVLRLELDYELAVLFEAMENKDSDLKSKTKKKLLRIRDELMRLKALQQ
ncbi:hypothetical protein Q73_04810 [Bacillus coahuilensis m2-6]|uniref:Uncharacterized protein n=1 Tax=Bacillus coahuilensis p1.1.43 TaxID=1150625 RepID=A0A147KAF4_9BACI|nr:hypothetical protein [Bacillus coahuilensis]KUP07657.1 hypothetical protein Q75_05375 [Bacillus coahuilensis p1.1.43]KUP08798.1 hypothetical protein Q73_04810 [Bacillus coahuilensis m2-6]